MLKDILKKKDTELEQTSKENLLKEREFLMEQISNLLDSDKIINNKIENQIQNQNNQIQTQIQNQNNTTNNNQILNNTTNNKITEYTN